jgi:predicted transcriptional regulator
MLTGARVRDAMQTQFSTLAPEDSLRRAAELVMAGSQHDFPVVADGKCVGILTRELLLQSLPQLGLLGEVAETMMPTELQVDADEALESAMARIQTAELPLMPVMSRGKLVGLLESENISELFLIRAALEQYNQGPRRISA